MGSIFFFTNVGTNLAKNIQLPDNDVSIYDYLEGEVGHTMFINPVDDQESIRTVQNCKKIKCQQITMILTCFIISSLGSRCVPCLGEGFSMPSPNHPVLCCPLPYRIAPVFVQAVSPPLGWSPLSYFPVAWSTKWWHARSIGCR